MNIKQLIALITVILAALLALAAGASLWVFSNAEERIARAVYSYEQLALATGLETTAARQLLADVQERAGYSPEPLLPADRSGADASINALIERIREEIGSIEDPQEQAEEAEEFVAAFAIRADYARLSKNLADGKEDAAGTALNQAALASFLSLDELLIDVVRGERREVEAAVAELADFRRALRSYALIASAVAILAVLGLALMSYRALMGPLRRLDEGSAQLADGNIGHRIRPSGPPEYQQLAERLNDMAGRLEAQRNALHRSNEELEQLVEDRTRELEEKARRLQDIDDSRRLFFAKVGHELRTPLTVLLGETEVALQTRSTDVAAYREALEHIGANGENLKRRIADLMALARSEDGRLDVELQPVDLAELARDTLQAVRGFATSNELDVSLRLAETDLAALADGDRVRQALLALIDNAIKFAPPETDIELRLARLDEDKAVFTVADHGPGIAEEELDLVSQPFFQGSQGAARAGTGLGLAVAHWVAQQHGGYCEVRNREGGGLLAMLVVPLAGPDQALGRS